MKLANESKGGWWVVGQMVLLGAILVAPRNPGGLPEWPETIRPATTIGGAILSAAGLLVLALGGLHLGSNLTPFPRPKDDAMLVQNGVYGVVRHPIYAGILLGALGWSLLRASTPSLILSLVLALFFDQKAQREETWLEQKFPEYAEYRQRVPRRVW